MLLRSIVAAGGNGETVRKVIDCLIASTAIRAGVPILHNDADFEVLASPHGIGNLWGLS